MSTRDQEYNDDYQHRGEKHDDEDFGLPEVEYNRVRDEDEVHDETVHEDEHHHVVAGEKPQITRERREENKSSAAPLIIVLILLLIAVGGGVWWFFLRDTAPEPIPPVAEQTTTEPEANEEEFSSGFDEPEPVAEEPARPATGQIENLSARTGRYYVVVNSFFDGDLAMDYAKKLSADGINVSIILPSGKNKFHRVAVEGFDSYAAAADRAEELKATYGNETWAVRY